ncbi:unnamed protein product [Dovyalis caffra]|uniref:TIR domain-containing protein n=1 Tax=Dovyalis caffra TaxID=77055 RepID=A0AAV1SL24_9ROSI|nr:unnamed protein product [Dovyalis caffra]
MGEEGGDVARHVRGDLSYEFTKMGSKSARARGATDTVSASTGPSAELVDSVGKRTGRKDLGSVRSWEMKSHDPPRAFFLLVGGVEYSFGWERMETRTEQELVVKRTTGCIVFPVFYDDPSQVRKQTGSFATAFVEEEKQFTEEMERLDGRRIALKEVADLAGMVLGDG